MKTEIIKGHTINDIFKKYTEWLLDNLDVDVIQVVYNEDDSKFYYCEAAIVYKPKESV